MIPYFEDLIDVVKDSLIDLSGDNQYKTYNFIGMVRDGDLVIILTKSGSTAESIALYNVLALRNVELWLLTFSKDGELSKAMDNILLVHLEHEGDKWNIVPNNSTTLNLIILQALAIEISKRMNVSLHQFKMNHPGGAIGDALKNV